jgi:CheY-like chemotaxis protein
MTHRPDPSPPTDRHVLVVDDEPDIRSLLATRIRRLGWTVHTAGTGEEALAATAAAAPALVVLDVLLPGIDGWETLRRLRADPALAGVPVLVVSICDPHADVAALGVAGYLVKPFTAADVERAVRSAVGEPNPPTPQEVPA